MNNLKKISSYINIFLIGYIEFGIIHYLYDKGSNINNILLCLLFFQIGQFLTILNVKIQKKFMLFLIVIVIILFILNDIFIYIFSFLVGYILVSARDNKSIENKLLKNSIRISGIVLSFSFDKLLTSILLIIISVFLLKDNHKKSLKAKIKLDHIVIIHQIHYYLYIYILTYFINEITNSRISSALIISASWITYLFIGSIFKKNDFKIFSYSNIILFIVFLLCYFTFFSITFIIIFILSGLFSGTIIYYKKYLKNQKTYNKIDYDFSEYIGHIFGCILSLALIIIIKNNLNLIFLISGICCLVLVILLFINKMKGKYKNDY